MSKEIKEGEPETTPNANEVIAMLDKAHAEVSRICTERWHRTGDWRMSIPAREDYDSDLIIGRALQAAKKALGG